MIAARSTREGATLAFATIVTCSTLLLVPRWSGEMTEICRLAGLSAVIVMGILIRCRWLGSRGAIIERTTAAMFLAGMPVVYVIRWFEVGELAGASSLAVELLGLVVFGGLAAVGARRSPWLLVGGIAAHGLAWDAWHWLFRSRFMFDWYAIGCLACDLVLAAYLAWRVAAWRAASLEPAP